MVKDLSVGLRLNEKLGNYSVFNDNTSGKLVFLLVDVSQYEFLLTMAQCSVTTKPLTVVIVL